MFLLSLGEQELKIAIWRRVSWVRLNLDLTLWVATDFRGVNCSKWEVRRVASCPSGKPQKVENFHLGCLHFG